MAQQGRYILRSLLFLVLALVLVAVLNAAVLRAFLANPLLNGLILAVLGLGIAYNFRRMLALAPERRWIEGSRSPRPGVVPPPPPRLLAPLATALGERDRRGRPSLAAPAARFLLDSTEARLDESREIARYQTGLLIFLGLLGTFWGLLEAIGSVSTVISGLSVGAGDPVVLFDQMKQGLARPLEGMGTAFSASLFGLAGSLVLGFLDLQAGQAQNRFLQDLEEWLSAMTRFGMAEGAVEGTGAQPLPVYVQAMLEQTAENLEQLHGTMVRGEEGRHSLNLALTTLNDRLGTLSERLSREQDLLLKMTDMQVALAEQLGRRSGILLDEQTREHIKNADVLLGRLLDEISREREELKSELKLVARTIAIAAGEPAPLRSA